jgi:WD40 repeat protein
MPAIDSQQDWFIACWSIATGQMLKKHKLGKRPGWVEQNFVPDARAKTIAEVDHKTGIVTLWDRDKGRTRSINVGAVTGDNPFVFVSFSPDGSVLAAGAQTPHKASFTLWDVATGERLATSPPVSSCQAIAFTPDGRELVMSTSPCAMIWRLDPYLATRLAGGDHTAEAVAFSSDGRLLATAGDAGGRRTIRIWHPASARVIRHWQAGEGEVRELAFSPDRELLASAHLANKDNVRLWNVTTGNLVATFPGHSQQARAVAFSPDGTLLASGGGDGDVRVWDLQRGSCRTILRGHSGSVVCVSFSPDGALLGTACEDGVRVWEVATGNEHAFLSREKGRLVSFSPDGSTLRMADKAGNIMMWEMSAIANATSTTSQPERATLSGGAGETKALAFAPDGSSIATGGESGKIHIWDTLTGQELLMLEGEKQAINDLVFSADGSTIASCHQDGSVKLWHSGR